MGHSYQLTKLLQMTKLSRVFHNVVITVRFVSPAWSLKGSRVFPSMFTRRRLLFRKLFHRNARRSLKFFVKNFPSSFFRRRSLLSPHVSVSGELPPPCASNLSATMAPLVHGRCVHDYTEVTQYRLA